MSFVKRFQSSLESLYQLPANAHYVIAYSGGLDSHVLLHCCNQLNFPVRAVHVHHGLQDVADDWVKHCQLICEQLSIPLDVFYVDAKPQQGLSPEETARNVRYQAIHKNLKSGDCLITAQHKNDQAETLLLQLFRTASAAGLAAMPAIRDFGDAVHVRPLLSFSRKEILDYATSNNLHWVEDPSNQDTGINRNFIRKEVLPVLQNRWPEVTAQLSTVANLQSNNLQVLEDMAAIDLANLVEARCINHGGQTSANNNVYQVESQLCITGLKDLSTARLLNVLRLWIIKISGKQPRRKLLSEIEKTLIKSSQDAAAVLKFSAYEFRRFKNSLYLLKPKLLKSALPESESMTSSQQSYNWTPRQVLKLPHLNMQITSQPSIGNNCLPKSLLEETLVVSFRKGGERFHPAGRKHSQSLKKLLQEAGVPPWERDCIPLVYRKDELIAVADLWVAKAFSTGSDEGGWLVQIASFDD